MPASVDEVPELVPLERPRALRLDERALLEFVIEPLGCDELREQVEQAEVVARCSCGCPSVGLRSDAAALPSDVVQRLSAVSRDDVLSLTTWGVNREARVAEVTLHVACGMVQELEVWVGCDGGEVITELPAPETMGREPPRACSARGKPRKGHLAAIAPELWVGGVSYGRARPVGGLGIASRFG